MRCPLRIRKSLSWVAVLWLGVLCIVPRLPRAGRSLTAQLPDVGVDHHPDELIEAHRRLPSEALADLRRVPDQDGRVGRAPPERLVAPDVLTPVETYVLERGGDEFFNRVRLAGRDHVVVRLVGPEHQPHRSHVVTG